MNKPIASEMPRIGAASLVASRIDCTAMSMTVLSVISVLHVGHGQWWKLVMSELTTSAHPSTITNNKSLNGNETNTGGSMNIPMDISVELTTKSMIKNGTKMTNPMMNAV